MHRVKANFERNHQHAILRKEWVELANVGFPATLCYLVSPCRVANNNLVTANLDLVHAVVKQQKYQSATKENLVQEGTLGLVTPFRSLILSRACGSAPSSHLDQGSAGKHQGQPDHRSAKQRAGQVEQGVLRAG